MNSTRKYDFYRKFLSSSDAEIDNNAFDLPNGEHRKLTASEKKNLRSKESKDFMSSFVSEYDQALEKNRLEKAKDDLKNKDLTWTEARELKQYVEDVEGSKKYKEDLAKYFDKAPLAEGETKEGLLKSINDYRKSVGVTTLEEQQEGKQFTPKTVEHPVLRALADNPDFTIPLAVDVGSTFIPGVGPIKAAKAIGTGIKAGSKAGTQVLRQGSKLIPTIGKRVVNQTLASEGGKDIGQWVDTDNFTGDAYDYLTGGIGNLVGEGIGVGLGKALKSGVEGRVRSQFNLKPKDIQKQGLSNRTFLTKAEEDKISDEIAKKLAKERGVKIGDEIDLSNFKKDNANEIKSIIENEYAVPYERVLTEGAMFESGHPSVAGFKGELRDVYRNLEKNATERRFKLEKLKEMEISPNATPEEIEFIDAYNQSLYENSLSLDPRANAHRLNLVKRVEDEMAGGLTQEQALKKIENEIYQNELARLKETVPENWAQTLAKYKAEAEAASSNMFIEPFLKNQDNIEHLGVIDVNKFFKEAMSDLDAQARNGLMSNEQYLAQKEYIDQTQRNINSMMRHNKNIGVGKWGETPETNTAVAAFASMDDFTKMIDNSVNHELGKVSPNTPRNELTNKENGALLVRNLERKYRQHYYPETAPGGEQELLNSRYQYANALEGALQNKVTDNPLRYGSGAGVKELIGGQIRKHPLYWKGMDKVNKFGTGLIGKMDNMAEEGAKRALGDAYKGAGKGYYLLGAGMKVLPKEATEKSLDFWGREGNNEPNYHPLALELWELLNRAKEEE